MLRHVQLCLCDAYNVPSLVPYQGADLRADLDTNDSNADLVSYQGTHLSANLDTNDASADLGTNVRANLDAILRTNHSTNFRTDTPARRPR